MTAGRKPGPIAAPFAHMPRYEAVVYIMLIGIDISERTDDMNQIQAALDFDARPRRVELVDARLIRDSGRRRATLGGDMAVVWEAV